MSPKSVVPIAVFIRDAAIQSCLYFQRMDTLKWCDSHLNGRPVWLRHADESLCFDQNPHPWHQLQFTTTLQQTLSHVQDSFER